jgi:hypothetical protein
MSKKKNPVRNVHTTKFPHVEKMIAEALRDGTRNFSALVCNALAEYLPKIIGKPK